MKEIYLVTVGKLKDKELEKIENDYLKRIKSPKLKIIECKSHSENKALEADEVLKKIGDVCKDATPYIILMAEKGELRDSQKFSKWLFKLVEKRSEKIFFVIGGAAGHGDEVIQRSKESISLSPLTFPHKIARVLMVEQLYRAQSIQAGHPYHK